MSYSRWQCKQLSGKRVEQHKDPIRATTTIHQRSHSSFFLSLYHANAQVLVKHNTTIVVHCRDEKLRVRITADPTLYAAICGHAVYMGDWLVDGE